MNVDSDCKYTKEHEWAKDEAEGIRVGISDYAQIELGDVVFVELPEVGTDVTAGESFGTVESVKAVSDVYAPVDGKVIAVNETLADTPELINAGAFSEGWMAVLEPSDPAQLEELLSASAYAEMIEEISK